MSQQVNDRWDQSPVHASLQWVHFSHRAYQLHRHWKVLDCGHRNYRERRESRWSLRTSRDAETQIYASVELMYGLARAGMLKKAEKWIVDWPPKIRKLGQEIVCYKCSSPGVLLTGVAVVEVVETQHEDSQTVLVLCRGSRSTARLLA